MFLRKTTDGIKDAVAVPSKSALNLAGVAITIGLIALVLSLVALTHK